MGASNEDELIHEFLDRLIHLPTRPEEIQVCPPLWRGAAPGFWRL